MARPAEALRVAAESGQAATLADLEAEPRPDDVGLVDDVGPGAEGLLDPALPLAPDLRRLVAVVDVEAVGEDVVEQRIGQARAGVGSPSAEPPHLLRDVVEPLVEVRQEAGLTDAGIADDGHHLPLPLLGDFVEAILQLAQLEVAPDRARVDPHHAAPSVDVETTGPFALDQVGIDRLVDPLQLQSGLVLGIERATHEPVGVGRDEDAAPRRGALQAGSPIDDLSDDHELLARAVAERARHHLAGVDADAHLERDVVGWLRSRR